jgi:hypothetical protein
MNLNQWSFVLSVLGLALGLISAYPQLRGGAKRVLKIGTDGAIRLLNRLYSQADFFIAFPSALVAYIAKSLFMLVAIFITALLFLRSDSPTHLSLPPWLQLILSLVITFAIGKIGGDLLNVLRIIVKRAKQMHDEQSNDG